MFPDIRPAFTHVERILVDFTKIKKPTVADFMAYRSRLVLGDYLDRYRAKANEMSDDEFKGEKTQLKTLRESYASSWRSLSI